MVKTGYNLAKHSLAQFQSVVRAVYKSSFRLDGVALY